MVVQNTTSKIRQYLGVTLTILMKCIADWWELDVCETNMLHAFFGSLMDVFLDGGFLGILGFLRIFSI